MMMVHDDVHKQYPISTEEEYDSRSTVTSNTAKLTHDIFSILENNFLFGHQQHDHHYNQQLSLINKHQHYGKVRILSIDDNGDGILAAKTLLHLQSFLRTKSANPTSHIADFFDVVTGAGAGGVLAALLFTQGKKPCAAPLFTVDESLKFITENSRKLTNFSPLGIFSRRRTSKAAKLLKKVFGDLTLKDTLKAVLIPCYDLRTGAPFVFSRADALGIDGCNFLMADVCGATIAVDQAVELKSIESGRTTKIKAVGGGVGMSNPTAAAITHVLNNKQEFPVCRGVEDLLVLSLGNGVSGSADSRRTEAFLKIAGDGAADMVDEAVSMAFGESRRSNYVRIQGRSNGRRERKKKLMMSMGMADEILEEKNVESVLFQGKKLVETTNLEKLEMFAGELIKEEERRIKYDDMTINLPNVILKQYYSNYDSTNTTARSSSATSTPSSTLSSC